MSRKSEKQYVVGATDSIRILFIIFKILTFLFFNNNSKSLLEKRCLFEKKFYEFFFIVYSMNVVKPIYRYNIFLV